METPQASTKPLIENYRVIRAQYTPQTITVYQAYSPQIAEPAIRAGTFVPPFRRERMTWIKPSFLWMAYRSGWATKPHQERVLAIKITRDGFEWALRHSCLSHHAQNQDAWRKKLQSSPVRVQWDPERDLSLRPLAYRAIQIGLGRDAVGRYVDEWIVSISDVTEQMKQIAQLVVEGREDEAKAALPEERDYPISDELRAILDAS